jgi:hypothetical protein
MGRDILSEFGPNRRIKAGGPEDGGDMTKEQRDVLNYKPPSGPIGIGNASVGLGGSNCGNRGSQESRSVFGDGAGGMASNGRVRCVQGRYD